MHAFGHQIKILRVLSATCLLLMLCIATLRAQFDPLVKMGESLKGNVVAIRATFDDDSEEQGFGFITGEEGSKLFIATAAHVVFKGRKASRIEVKFFNKIDWFSATYKVHWDEPDDLALLELTKPFKAKWRSDCANFSPRFRQAVLFLGRYVGGKPVWNFSARDGAISEPSENTISFSIDDIQPGCSGAPLFNEKGIIGMVKNADNGNSSEALTLSRIRKLFSNDGQYPYFGLSNAAEMVSIPGGIFIMGCTSGTPCSFDDKPNRTVTLSAFLISETEVTQELWQQMMGANPSRSCIDPQCPVESVSWYEALVFCNRLSEKYGFTPCYYLDNSHTQVFGKSGSSWSQPDRGTIYWKTDANGYRLPTEAEWERAARGGSSTLIYSGGMDLEPVAWNAGNSDGISKPVKQKKPNGFGLYDMSGNVSEWCWDWYGENYYGTSPVASNPTGPNAGSDRVFRGGSFGDPDPYRVSVAFRAPRKPDMPHRHIGFRLARTL